MTTITLTPEIEGPLAEEARRRGTTAETLALESLRRLFAPADALKGSPGGETLFDFLADHMGTISGTTEALSEKCGGRFADAMVEKHSRGVL
jgi:hypothetical protein